jgi:hypothetical protein
MVKPINISKYINKYTPRIKSFKTNISLRIKKYSLKLIEFIVNIDISFIYIFALSYFFLPTIPLWIRVIGSWGIYHSYKLLVEDITRIVVIKNR